MAAEPGVSARWRTGGPTPKKLSIPSAFDDGPPEPKILLPPPRAAMLRPRMACESRCRQRLKTLTFWAFKTVILQRWERAGIDRGRDFAIVPLQYCIKKKPIYIS